MKKETYSLNELDIKMEKYLNNINNGFFIEVGAYDGITQSNTYLYEKKGWKGLLIEPIQKRYNQCLQNRKNSIIENCCLVSDDFKKDEIEIFEKGPMSIVNDSKTHNGSAKQHVKNIIRPTKCKTTTLTKLLEKHNINKIDFFSLDVEGYELEVLKGLDFTKYKPKYILFECNLKDQIEKITKLLIDNGYEFLEKLSHHDHLFKIKL